MTRRDLHSTQHQPGGRAPASADEVEVGQFPGVSVVIPTYNYARFLTDAIESALAQTYQNIEVLVIDDGSTDETADLVKRFGDKIRYLYKENAGLSAARNTGIDHASFPLIVFLDADDVLTAGMVQRSVDTLMSLPVDYGLVACCADTIDAGGHLMPRGRIQLKSPTEVTARDLVLINRFSPAVLVRREVFSRVGNFDTSLKSSEDRDMWIRIAAECRIQLLPDRLVLKRAHGNNMSSNADRQSASVRKVLKKAFFGGTAPVWDTPFWARAFALYLFQSALMYHENRKLSPALRKMITSLLLWPLPMCLRNTNRPALFRLRALARMVLAH